MRRGFVAALAALLVVSVVAPVLAAPTDPTSPEQRPRAGSVATPTATPTPAANESGPTVEATLNGRDVADGDFRVFRNETHAVLNVTVRAPGERTLDAVLLRVDGRTVVDEEGAGANFTFNGTLPTGAGNNTVRIVAKDSADTLTTTRFWAYIERVPPEMALRRPVRTVPDPYDYQDFAVRRAQVRFAGNFTDLTGVRSASVAFVDPSTTTQYDKFGVGPGGAAFDEAVLLKRGRNRVEVSTEDVLGNTYATAFRVQVVDDEAPDIALSFDGHDDATARHTVSGEVTDNVWIRNVSIRVLHVNHGPFEEGEHDYTAVERKRYEHSADRLDASFSREVRLLEGRNYVSVRAVDHRGQRAYRGYWIEYYPDRERPPTVSLLRNRTRIHGNSSVDIAALVTDGDRDLERVLVEVQNLDTGRVTDVETVRPDDDSTFLLERSLRIAAGVNRIDVTAADARGNSSETTLYVDTRRQEPSREPPAGYGDGSGGGERPGDVTPATVTPVTDAGSGDATATPPASTPTQGPATERGEGAQPTTDGDAVDSGGLVGGLLGALTSLPGLVVLAVVVVGFGYWVWIKLTRV